jgi:hypothetical protein
VAFVRIVNTWRVSLVLTYNSGLTAVMTFSVLDVGGVRNAARANTIAAEFVTWWNANAKSATISELALSQVNVLDLDSAVGVSVVYTTGLPISGTNSNAPAPQNAAPVITLRTPNRGRAFRGRSFFAGADEGAFNAGDGTSITPGAITIFNAAYAALITAIATITSCNLAVGSRVLGASTVITSAQCRTHIGTQRRRVKSP